MDERSLLLIGETQPAHFIFSNQPHNDCYRQGHVPYNIFRLLSILDAILKIMFLWEMTTCSLKNAIFWYITQRGSFKNKRFVGN
jgi:hypothetical protein